MSTQERLAPTDAEIQVLITKGWTERQIQRELHVGAGRVVKARKAAVTVLKPLSLVQQSRELRDDLIAVASEVEALLPHIEALQSLEVALAKASQLANTVAGLKANLEAAQSRLTARAMAISGEGSLTERGGR